TWFVTDRSVHRRVGYGFICAQIDTGGIVRCYEKVIVGGYSWRDETTDPYQIALMAVIRENVARIYASTEEGGGGGSAVLHPGISQGCRDVAIRSSCEVVVMLKHQGTLDQGPGFELHRAAGRNRVARGALVFHPGHRQRVCLSWSLRGSHKVHGIVSRAAHRR